MPLTRKRIPDLLLEVLIGLGLVGVVILYAEVGPFAWMPSARWWGLAAMTGLLLWTVVKRFRRHWPKPSFWLNLTWLTALHLTAWSIVLLRATVWGMLWFVPPTVVEGGLLVLALHKLGYHMSDVSRSGAA
jgi:hypothetical protein